MGKVICEFAARNWRDVEDIAYGMRSAPAREVSAEALVDTGATKLYFKSSVVRQLGLRQTGESTSKTMSNRLERRRIYSPVELEIQGRASQFPVVEVPDDLPNIVGQILLEELDWVVDPRRQKLIPNPAHKDGEMFDDF